MTGPDLVRHYFRQQSAACRKLGSPFMGRLMALMDARLTEATAVGARVLHWTGDPSPAADNPSLRLAGGLHALVLTQTDPGLVAVYPPHDATDDALWDAVARALTAHEAHLLAWLDKAPQTNEVRRSAALVPALHLLAQAMPGPLHLWELGCSAGLNLVCDRFRLTVGARVFGPDTAPVDHVPDWTGEAPAPQDLRIGDRRGVDLHPVDFREPRGQLRLRAYLWPDQPVRRALTDGAIALAQDETLEIDQADAVAWLRESLPGRPTQGTTVLFHTIAWQYLPPEARAQGDAVIAQAGARATAAAPLARIAMEADDEAPGAGLSLTLWPGGTRHALARTDYHGRWIRWTGPTRLDQMHPNQ